LVGFWLLFFGRGTYTQGVHISFSLKVTSLQILQRVLIVTRKNPGCEFTEEGCVFCGEHPRRGVIFSVYRFFGPSPKRTIPSRFFFFVRSVFSLRGTLSTFFMLPSVGHSAASVSMSWTPSPSAHEPPVFGPNAVTHEIKTGPWTYGSWGSSQSPMWGIEAVYEPAHLQAICPGLDDIPVRKKLSNEAKLGPFPSFPYLLPTEESAVVGAVAEGLDSGAIQCPPSLRINGVSEQVSIARLLINGYKSHSHLFTATIKRPLPNGEVMEAPLSHFGTQEEYIEAMMAPTLALMYKSNVRAMKD